MRLRAQYMQHWNSEWRIQVKNAFYGHCHQVSEEVYQSDPSIRQVPSDSPIMSDVELMVASGSKASRIYDYIRANSPNYVQLTDVYNMIARIQKTGASLSDEDQETELLVKFDLPAPGNVSAVDEDAHGHTAVVSISSDHMCKRYKRFPVILLVDCTHKTNRFGTCFIFFSPCFDHVYEHVSVCFAMLPWFYHVLIYVFDGRYNYQLCTLMVMDQFGNRQAV
ncbi:hypothetical protein JG688_00014660 [Phytophthora aleatoria]|uniref:ZSWIM1/3 RNaseH-like domain-containing protein n=1 Tax=Phytophthora aleatoria TaxID=2496075 RepID=A0A8J5IJH0_9STRA|nr:hypothetical protein JG688_00014660 [Phytophthora aleatoria]